MTPTERLEQIRRRCEAATKGPRKFEPTWFQHECSWGVAARSITTGDIGPDLEFYGHAREDIPFLLSALEAEQERVDEFRREVERREEIIAGLDADLEAERAKREEAEAERDESLKRCLDVHGEQHATYMGVLTSLNRQIDEWKARAQEWHDAFDRAVHETGEANARAKAARAEALEGVAADLHKQADIQYAIGNGHGGQALATFADGIRRGISRDVDDTHSCPTHCERCGIEMEREERLSRDGEGG